MTPWARTALILSWGLTFIAFLWLGSVTLSLAWSNRPSPGAANQQRGDAGESKAGQNESKFSHSGFPAQGAASEIQAGSDWGTQKPENKSAEWGAVIVASLALIVAIVQLCYFGTQLKFMRRELKGSAKASVIAERAANAAKESADSVIRSERAFLHIEEFFIPLGALTPGAVFCAKVKNSGHTPAKEVRGVVSFRSEPLDDKSHLSPMTLTANAYYLLYGKPIIEEVSEGRIANADASKITLLLWAVVEYWDVFDKKHFLHVDAVYSRNPPQVRITASYETDG